MSLQTIGAWLLEHAQGPKESLRIVSNFLWVMAMVQISGADLTKIDLHPPVPWWGTTCLSVLAWWGTVKISAWQEAKKVEAAAVVVADTIAQG